MKKVINPEREANLRLFLFGADLIIHEAGNVTQTKNNCPNNNNLLTLSIPFYFYRSSSNSYRSLGIERFAYPCQEEDGYRTLLVSSQYR